MNETRSTRGITRRILLQRAATAGAAVALSATPPAYATKRGRRAPSVAVLGGGMAGLAAAHE
ncbi:MAG TPA: twin-arginine translocation signal domain-containing protein, partial [Solirubrobacteraceae bacterium]